MSAAASLNLYQLAQKGRSPECTDLGNAARLVSEWGRDLRYCSDTAAWYVWSGVRWVEDKTGEVERRTKDTIRYIYAEAEGASKSGHSELAGELAVWAKRSQNKNRIQAAIELARTESCFSIRIGDIDRDPWLFNTTAGTLDLRTGQLRDHDPADLIDKECAVEFHPDAECPTYDRFIDEIMLGRADLIEYTDRLMGYALTADVSHHVLPIFFGTGRNGKSTLLDLALHIFGKDYAGLAPDSLLTAKRNNEHPTELAKLVGKRLVIASETEDGCKLKTAQIKRLTGDTVLTARRMRQDYFDFRRTFKIIMATNNRPVVAENTVAIWRRLQLVPFDLTVPEATCDTELLPKLIAEAPGILARWVRGCHRWVESGHNLASPEAVTVATAEYREDEDAIGRFVEDCLLESPSAKCSSAELHEEYLRWAQANREPTLKRQQLTGELLKRPGIDKATFRSAGKVVRGLSGVGILKTTPEGVYRPE